MGVELGEIFVWRMFQLVDVLSNMVLEQAVVLSVEKSSELLQMLKKVSAEISDEIDFDFQ